MDSDLLFKFLSNSLGIPLDKVRYGTLFFISFPLALILRLSLSYKYTSNTMRHLYCAVIGIIYCWLCFKWQVFYLLGFVAFGYVILLTLPAQVVHTYSLLYAMIAVSVGHIYRMVIDYGAYSLDFSFPLMLIVQRVSYVAYAYNDGVVKDQATLNADQLKQKISKLPTLLEYFSYNFCFLTILAGPTATYKEYDEFITGRNMKNAKLEKFDSKGPSPIDSNDPSPIIPVLKKLCGALVFMALHLTNDDKMANERILDSSLTFFRRYANVAIYAFLVRCQYYFSHLLVESISNAGGLGFNGYDEHQNPKWDLVKNIDVFKFELGTNLREQIVVWNITTQTWLKRVVYERFHWSPVLVTCLVSSVWHGFYPGYFVSFIFVAIVTVAARKLRLLLWHHFQEPFAIKILYDIVTTVITNFGKDLIILTFWLLTLENVTALWSNYNYSPLITVGLIAILLPNKKQINKK